MAAAKVSAAALKVIERVALRIRELRNKAHLTQETIATQASVQLATIKRYERGKNMKLDVLVGVAAALEVDLRALLDEPGDDVPERVAHRPSAAKVAAIRNDPFPGPPIDS